jgi:L-ascorbate metabolism protein UlaG (beta-lactamase superfamily)
MRYDFAVISLAAFLLIFASGCVQTNSQTNVTNSTNETGASPYYQIGAIKVEWLGHSSLRLSANSTVIYIDPYVLDENATKADFILISHNHPDHCDLSKIAQINRTNTKIVGNGDCIDNLTGRIFSTVPKDYYNFTFEGVYIEAYDAYNLNSTYHPKGEGLGFFIIWGGKKIYYAGDTDNIPEFSNLTSKNIDLLIEPIGGKYTMDVAAAGRAANIIKPKIVIPIHYNSTKYGYNDINADPNSFRQLLEGSDINVEILGPLA